MLSDWVISFHENTHAAYAGGYVGEYFLVILRLVLGNSASTVGNISGGFVSELINYDIKNYPTPTNKKPEHE